MGGHVEDNQASQMTASITALDMCGYLGPLNPSQTQPTPHVQTGCPCTALPKL